MSDHGGHVRLVHANCEAEFCPLCVGGLFVCAKCGQAEAQLADVCPKGLPKIYLIQGFNGEYSDKHEWLECAFHSKDQADKECERLNREAEKKWKALDKYRSPLFSDQSTYEVWEVEVRDEG